MIGKDKVQGHGSDSQLGSLKSPSTVFMPFLRYPFSLKCPELLRLKPNLKPTASVFLPGKLRQKLV